MDILEKLTMSNGPIRLREDPKLSFDLQPFVMPMAFDMISESLAYFDRNETIQIYWQLNREGKSPIDSNIEEIIRSELAAESLINDAKNISVEVRDIINKTMDTNITK